jgi:Phage tail sheath C-terminal domain
MALVSPGVQVTIVDQSQYLSGATNSVPIVFLATAANKTNPNSPGTVAVGTIPANANTLTTVTSQQDLISLFGNPFFYNTTNGTPINGYQLNEYGLLAAYYALGLTNQIYVVRAAIDLASLIGSVGRPEGDPANGAWWLNTTASTWGIYEFDATTGTFMLQSPIVINTDDANLISAGFPVSSIGTIGDYCVIATPINSGPGYPNGQQFFYKNATNTWVALGTQDWLNSVPTVVGSESNPTLNPGDTFYINLNSPSNTTTAGRALITVPNYPNNTVYGLAGLINTLGWGGLSAQVISGRLQLYSAQANTSPLTNGNYYITIASGSGSVLTQIGIGAGPYYQPQFVYGTSAQQPLWQASQAAPAPSGSVWIKAGSAGNGLQPVVEQWSSSSLSWKSKTVTVGTSDWTIDAYLDSTGGQAIPAGTVYAQYAFDGSTYKGPVYLWTKSTTGPTVATGSVTSPTFSYSAGNTAEIYVSVPSSTSLAGPYTMNLQNVTSASSFVTQWYASGVPYTTASVNSSGAIVLTHTAGGVIVVDDLNYATGLSYNLMNDAGFVAGATTNVKFGFAPIPEFTPAQYATTGSGTNLQIHVSIYYGSYVVNNTSFVNAGAGYAIGDQVTFLGSALGGGDDLVVIVTGETAGVVTAIQWVSGNGSRKQTTQISNWVTLTPAYSASLGAPNVPPANGKLWYYSDPTQVDIMVNVPDTGWVGYRNTNYDSNGFPTSGSNQTDPNGPIVAFTAPTTQSTGASLQYGDLWIDTSDLEKYPLVNRWQNMNGMDQWVLLDNTDQINSSGIIYEDARWAPNGDTNPATDPIPTIQSLLTSDYLDLDAPLPNLYPVGMLLWNTRRSGYTVKAYEVNYFNANSFPDQSLPTQTSTWVTQSGNMENGAPYMGQYAQRALVVKSLRATVETNVDIRDEDNYFNLQACPFYPELQPDMVTLNFDRGQTSYILGDTPMTLPNEATSLVNWATNKAGAASTGLEGCVTRDTYLGLFYPSGLSTDLAGNLVAVPPSHMMLSTFLYNDQVAYPWLAAAGTRRGIINNATSIGYVDAQTGAFVSIKTSQGIRDVLYENNINPLVFFTGQGLLNYGNITSYASQSALDRVNVARLICYIRRQLTIAARPFVFEPNDSITRKAISGVIQSFFVDLVAKRGIYDYLVVCDNSNNTPARIDANELWVDCAIEPVKAAEFIYIPVRILATGTIGGNNG